MYPAPTMFFLAWGGNHFTPLLHFYRTVAHFAPWQVNLMLGMYVIGLIPGLLIAPTLSERHGRKPLVLVGALLGLLGTLLLASSQDTFLLLCLGRALAGTGLGIAMSVGTSWMKELSSPPFELHAAATVGARRPALTLTLGFGIGAAVTGSLAQWGPAPGVTPFVLHGAVSVVALLLLLRAPETVPRGVSSGAAWWRRFAVPTARTRRFRRLILPAAPWVFGASGVAYAIMPAVVSARLGGWATLYATVLTVLTLGSGAIVQSLVPWINRHTHGRGLIVGLALMSIGMMLAVVASLVGNPWLAFVVALVLGIAYGILVVAGLIIVQSIAGPRELAGLTGIYYALCYSGFLSPTIFALLLPIFPYALSLTVTAGLCLLSLTLVSLEMRRTRAERPEPDPDTPAHARAT